MYEENLPSAKRACWRVKFFATLSIEVFVFLRLLDPFKTGELFVKLVEPTSVELFTHEGSRMLMTVALMHEEFVLLVPNQIKK
jgi:hypothetical protein